MVQHVPSKRHHVFLTIYLALLVAANPCAALLCMAKLANVKRPLPDEVWWMAALAASLAAANTVGAIALFRWKKWGFWVLSVSAAVGFLVNIGLDTTMSGFGGLLGIVILLLALNIGDENQGWPQLE